MVKRARSNSPSPDIQAPGSDGEPAITAKAVHLDRSKHACASVISCSLPPHPLLSFSSFEDYEIHYNKSHLHRCVECKKNFPTDHFLSLHIAENHDPLNEAKRARGDKTYACFVEDCDKICSVPGKRRMHLIDKHHFPQDYDFYIVNDGLGKRTSMLRSPASMARQRRSSAATTSTASQLDTADSLGLGERSSATASGTSEGSLASKIATSDGVEALSKSMASLKFVPPSVRFGRGRGRGLAKR